MFLFFSLSPLGFANIYSRGNWSCTDFKNMEQTYRSDPENIYFQRGYARCLITRGDDTQGMAILHDIVKYSDHPGRVGAAWMIANYLSSGGTFEDVIDENNINEAIKAYGKVVFFIRLDPNYPNGNGIYEEEAQIELKSHHFLPLLYFEKFRYGIQGSSNAYWQNSLSYSGNGGLNTYQVYSPYTIDSLNKTIEFANQCLDLPFKRYFKHRVYEKIKAGCRVLKEVALTLLPIEQERLILLNTNSCSDDLVQCDEFKEVFRGEIIPIIQQANLEMKEIFKGTASAQKEASLQK